MGCSDCIEVESGEAHKSDLNLLYGEDWVIEDRFTYGDNGENYYNMDNASIEMYIKANASDSDNEAILSYSDVNFTRDQSDEAVADGIAFNDQVLLIIPWDSDIADNLSTFVPYHFFIRITDPTLGTDKIYNYGTVTFYHSI